ncbi:uncharacterized protein F4807DRAFT_21831 [Annulohypoxylon truncatum]|uniref:uncharacterized protein n=1 Tax=Annulohypoxylon truncatum TaxID=327061 RepID=UPI002008A129|nr:uncharacterized protein F4807DRAFT_21831 [Annulohypoxylon truncatum]KAI1215128.1 hypothetical protein F4807DRAFT_21831 [Annulohypoxylon truncatum]
MEKEILYYSLRYKAENARKKIKPSHSFDVKYWTAAADASNLSAQVHEMEMHLAIQRWKEEENGGCDAEEWWTTPEAHRFVDQLKAFNYEKHQYLNQVAQLEQGGARRHASQSMFTTSQIGLGVDTPGVGKRPRSEQSKFKSSLIDFYNAATMDTRNPKVIRSVHDSATGQETLMSTIRAVQLVPHSLGRDVLIALFGSDVKGELDAPYNGLLLDVDVKEAMDDGVIVVVPNLPDNPSTEEVALWEGTEPKNYRWRIMDPDADILNRPVEVAPEKPTVMIMRDLDGKQLSFKNEMRPRARYLYFLFVVAQLRQAWRQEYRNDPSKVLAKQLGKGFWATKGRYLERSFLLALADEIGHDTKITENIPMAPGDDNDPDHTGVIGIAKLLQTPDEDSLDSDEDE